MGMVASHNPWSWGRKPSMAGLSGINYILTVLEAKKSSQKDISDALEFYTRSRLNNNNREVAVQFALSELTKRVFVQ